MLHFVMLRPDWPGTFRRRIRDAQAIVTDDLFFIPGQPVEVSDAQIESLQPDLGHAIVFCKVDAEGRPQAGKIADDQLLPGSPPQPHATPTAGESRRGRRHRLEPAAEE